MSEASQRASRRYRPGHPFLAGAPILFAHRGGAELAPENTLVAFRRAIEWWGADVLELDVHPTRDGEAVVIHDHTVNRTTNGSGPVASFDLEELSQLDAGYRFTADGGRTFPFRGQGERIPTLREVLLAFPDARVNVEIKDGRVQQRLWDVIHELNAAPRVLVASEKQANRARFSHYSGPTSASAEELRSFLLHQRLGTTRVFRTSVDAFQVPERYSGRQIISPRFIEDAQAKNIPVHAWTVNKENDMRRLLEWGVDGIMTDRPDLLARVLHEERGRPLPPGAPADSAGM